MRSLFAFYLDRNRDWQMLFLGGLLALAVALFNWLRLPSSHAAAPLPLPSGLPPLPAPAPYAASPAAMPAASVPPAVLRPVAPVVHLQASPQQVLIGIDRPPPSKPPVVPEFGVQRGYTPPQSPSRE